MQIGTACLLRDFDDLNEVPLEREPTAPDLGFGVLVSYHSHLRQAPAEFPYVRKPHPRRRAVIITDGPNRVSFYAFAPTWVEAQVDAVAQFRRSRAALEAEAALKYEARLKLLLDESAADSRASGLQETK